MLGRLQLHRWPSHLYWAGIRTRSSLHECQSVGLQIQFIPPVLDLLHHRLQRPHHQKLWVANSCVLNNRYASSLSIIFLRVYVLIIFVGSDQDYVQWLAHSDDISDPTDGCILGYKEKFLRLKKDSVCFNGRDYEVNTQPTPCLCTLDDFLW